MAEWLASVGGMQEVAGSNRGCASTAVTELSVNTYRNPMLSMCAVSLSYNIEVNPALVYHLLIIAVFNLLLCLAVDLLCVTLYQCCSVLCDSLFSLLIVIVLGSP